VTIRVGTGIRARPAPRPATRADAVVGDADHDLLGVQGGGRERGAVQDQVRAAGQDRLVLPGRRLALGGVHHDHRRQVLPPAGVEHRAHLAGEREARAAPAAQLDPVGEPDQLAGDSAAKPPCTSWCATGRGGRTRRSPR
jgi:hypothetical protein